MKKYFFVAFQLFYGKKQVGYGGFVVGCSCGFERIVEALLDDYNKYAEHKADKVIINALTVLDKQTAAQLSENFTNSALIIDDGDKEEDNKTDGIELLAARDKDGMICLFSIKNPPKKVDSCWANDLGEFIEIDGSLFPEVQWSDDKPTKVKLIIDK